MTAFRHHGAGRSHNPLTGDASEPYLEIETMTTATEKIITPCVHLNGTSKDALLDQLGEVYSALENARNMLKYAAPNGRDYYIGPHSLKDAQVQQWERMKAIDAVQRSIESEMELINAQE